MSANNIPLSKERATFSQITPEARNTKIRALNDNLRKHGIGGLYVVTRGVAAKDEFTRIQVFLEIALETNFNEENDPFCEHDFGK